MFTVKWIVKHKQGDVTRMFQANEVTCAYRNYRPPSETAAVPEDMWMVEDRQVRHALVILDRDVSLDGGVVYVMNEAGATVAKYKLSDEEVEYKSIVEGSKLAA